VCFLSIPLVFSVANNTTEAEEKLTPDSTKSTQQKVSETITDIADRVVRGGQTDDSKSTTQAAFDKAQRASDNAVHGGVTSSM
jgi:hypothetical protein